MAVIYYCDNTQLCFYYSGHSNSKYSNITSLCCCEASNLGFQLVFISRLNVMWEEISLMVSQRIFVFYTGPKESKLEESHLFSPPQLSNTIAPIFGFLATIAKVWMEDLKVVLAGILLQNSHTRSGSQRGTQKGRWTPIVVPSLIQHNPGKAKKSLFKDNSEPTSPHPRSAPWFRNTLS